MRVALLSPTPSSFYARATAALLKELDGIEFVGVVIRRMASWSRFRAEIRRDGPRLLRKIQQKLILGEAAYPGDEADTMRSLVGQLGLRGGSLRSDARRWEIPIITTAGHNHLRTESYLRSLQPDLIVFTGGGLVRSNILELAPLGVLNCHSGILPRYRGMDVVEWALLERAGLGSVGLTTHIMDSGVDTGPILLQHVEPLQPGDSIERIRRRLEARMVTLMIESVRGLQEGTLKPTPQLAAQGRQYFVMHPRLRILAERAIPQQGSAPDFPGKSC
jgi:methionyl-tRNA formyltransferase